MNKLNLILLSTVVLALAACRNQGGSQDEYNTDSGSASQSTNNRGSYSNSNQGGALSPGRSETGIIQSTNNPDSNINNQGGATNSYRNGGQPFDSQRTNNMLGN